MSPGKTILGFFGWVLLCFAAASPGALSPPGEWYAALQKPSWNPPGWIFGPVWSALYTLMGVAAWLVWRRGGFAAQGRPLGAFVGQLALNALWTPLFFGLHRPGVAFVEILLLWLAIVWTIGRFWRVHRGAAMDRMDCMDWMDCMDRMDGPGHPRGGSRP
jgi:translocator protein